MSLQPILELKYFYEIWMKLSFKKGDFYAVSGATVTQKSQGNHFDGLSNKMAKFRYAIVNSFGSRFSIQQIPIELKPIYSLLF